MKSVTEVASLCGVQTIEVELWVRRRWLLPMQAGGSPTFSEADVARARMILELRRDLAIDEDTMPVVLSLVDQVPGLRRQLRRVLGAMAELPEAQRAVLERRLARDDERGDG